MIRFNICADRIYDRLFGLQESTEAGLNEVDEIFPMSVKSLKEGL